MKKYALFALTICLVVLFNSCSDDDDPQPEDNSATMRFTPTDEASEFLFRGNGTLIINWGDNNIDTINNTTVDTIRHTYDKKGIEYRINITTSGTTEIAIQNNKVSSIELGVFPDIEKLTIKDMNIKNLDVSKNSKLINLIVTNCGINSIDISKNTALQRLYLSDNKLETIDISKNTALITFEANNNLLNSIDITNNKNLTSLSVKNNKLDSLQIDGNINIENIYLNENQLTALTATNNPNIKRLEITSNQFTKESIDSLFESLSDKVIWRKTVVVTGNPGAETCDMTIATSKGWSVSNK